MRSLTKHLSPVLAAAALLGAGSVTRADNWNMYLTVDNQFAVYYGTNLATNFFAGGGANWTVEYNFTATGRPATDYLYVATASDHGGAQGFLGHFTNTTTNASISTGSAVWQVFPAGAYQQTNQYWPNQWPASLMPTQIQVDNAIAFATTNNLWISPVSTPGYDNDPATPTNPYFYPWIYNYPNIPKSANWIWHNSGNDPGNAFFPAPINGFNHDEFLVFRVAGVAPEPTSLGLMVLGAAVILRRTRRGRSA